MKLYTIKELKEENVMMFNRAFNNYSRDLGATSESAFERYYQQEGAMFDIEGYMWVRRND